MCEPWEDYTTHLSVLSNCPQQAIGRTEVKSATEGSLLTFSDSGSTVATFLLFYRVEWEEQLENEKMMQDFSLREHRN